MLRPGTYLQDRYEILELIGSGGMSDVYKAKCQKLNRLVAVKVLKEEFSNDSSFVGSFKMEAQAAARLSHPNIVNRFGVVDEGILHYIVMELIEGITLKSYIAKKGRLDVKEAVGIAIQVAQGIAAAHEQQIVHRDIKPQNMIISKDGKVKVADFGIARAVTGQTTTVAAMGSVHYISPEQARGGYSDSRSDIYSLGITMYEMVTGYVPFQGDNAVAVALAHLEDPITLPSVYNPSIPISLEHIILKCTEKKPERRYAAVPEVITDLRRVLIHPNEDFVTIASDQDFGGETVTISDRELTAIKMGQQRRQDLSYDHMPEEYEQPERRYGSQNQRRTGNDGSLGLERIMSGIGIFAAILIVALLIFVFVRLGGLFRKGSSGTPTTIQTEEVPSSSQEETLNDTEIEMPDATNLPVDMASDMLEEHTLVMKIAGYEYSDTVEEGYVMSQTKPAGSIVKKYSSVYVFISKGSEFLDLSQYSFTNMNTTAIEELLRPKGILTKFQTEYSDAVAEGQVIRYEPQKPKMGDTVTFYVSAGSAEDMRTVPDLYNISEEEAIRRITDAGLLQGQVTKVHDDTIPEGYVMKQDVEANTMVKSQTQIPYVVSLGPESKRYIGAISTTYQMRTKVGPGLDIITIEVEVRLKQMVNGSPVYQTLMGPKVLTGNELLPIHFPSMEGAPGVEQGEVEVVNVQTGAVVESYPVRFFETE